MSKKIVDNFGKKTFSKMAFQVWVALVNFLDNDDIDVFAPDISGDALYIKKDGKMIIHEIKTDESDEDPVKLKTNVKKSIVDLTLFNKNPVIDETYLLHTHDIKFKGVTTSNGNRIPKEFGKAKVKYNSSDTISVELFNSKDTQPMYNKIQFKRDPEALWRDEFKRKVSSFSEKYGKENGMDFNEYTTLSRNLLELMESLMCIEVDFEEDPKIKAVAIKNGVSRKDIESKAKMIKETPREVEDFRNFLENKNYKFSKNEIQKITKSIFDSFTINDISRNFKINGLSDYMIEQYGEYKGSQDEN